MYNGAMAMFQGELLLIFEWNKIAIIKSTTKLSLSVESCAFLITNGSRFKRRHSQLSHLTSLLTWLLWVKPSGSSELHLTSQRQGLCWNSSSKMYLFDFNCSDSSSREAITFLHSRSLHETCAFRKSPYLNSQLIFSRGHYLYT